VKDEAHNGRLTKTSKKRDNKKDIKRNIRKHEGTKEARTTKESKQKSIEFISLLPRIDGGAQAANQEGLADAKARAVSFSAQDSNNVTGSTRSGVCMYGAACAVVVLSNSDVQRTDGTADIGGGTLDTFEAIDALGGEAKSTRRHRAASEVTLLLVRPLKSVSEFVGAVVQADRQIVLFKDARNTGIDKIG